MATGSSDGDVVQGVGALGGEPTPLSRTYLRRNGEEIRVKPHRLVPVKEKDVLVKHSAGGGGVGRPQERDPQLVADDLRKQFITPETARNVYKVAINPATFEVDEKGTKALRAGK
jgi:N-methylhydantoinase B